MTGPGNGITGAIPVENTSEQEIMGDSMGWVNTAGRAGAVA